MKNTLLFLTVFLFFCSFSFGQTVNTGKFYVAPGTTLSTLDDFENTSSASLYNDGNIYFYANFSNNGLLDYYEGNGMTRFVGFSNQLLTGQGTNYFWNVLFDNDSADSPFQLEAAINADGEVHFRDGIVNNRNYGGRFTFGKSATSGEATNNSHVDGPVEKLGNSDFEYPIGHNGYYRMAGTSENEKVSPSYEATYYHKNPDADYPLLNRPEIITNINDAEYWRIEPTIINTDLVVTLSWDDATTPQFLLQYPEGLHIVGWDEQQQLWLDEGGVVDESNKTVSAAVSSLGIFTLATVETSDVLPCQLAVYNAITPNNDGKNDYFIIDQLNNGGCTDKISVKIFNRWNVKVFETDNYGKLGNVFDGYSNGRGTIGDGPLPTGTYFYVLEFNYSTGEGTKKTYRQQGYLYLNGN